MLTAKIGVISKTSLAYAISQTGAAVEPGGFLILEGNSFYHKHIDIPSSKVKNEDDLYEIIDEKLKVDQFDSIKLLFKMEELIPDIDETDIVIAKAILHFYDGRKDAYVMLKGNCFIMNSDGKTIDSFKL